MSDKLESQFKKAHAMAQEAKASGDMGAFTLHSANAKKLYAAVKPYMADKARSADIQAEAKSSPYVHPSDRHTTGADTELSGQTIANVGAGLNKAGLEIANLPQTVYNTMGRGIADIATGDPDSFPSAPRWEDLLGDDVKEFTDKATGRFIPEGESAGADAAYTAGEWTGRVPMMAGAAIGEYAAGTGGEIAGGLLGLLKNPVKSMQELTAKPEVVKFLKANTEDFNLAMQKLKTNLDNGVKGTLAELTGDRMLARAENTITTKAKGGSDLEFKLQDIRMAREDQIIGDIEKLKAQGVSDTSEAILARKRELINRRGGDISAAEQLGLSKAEDALNVTDTRTAALDELATAETGEAAALAKLDDVDAPSVESTRLSDAYSGAEKKLYDETVKPLWQEFDGGKTFDSKALLAEHERRLAGLTPTERKQVEKDYKPVIDLIENWGNADNIAPSEIHAVVSELKALNQTAQNTGTKLSSNRLAAKVLSRPLEQTILSSGSNREAYQAAVDASADQFARFRPSGVNKARRGEPEVMGRALTGVNETGAVNAREVLASGDPALIKQYQQYLRARVKSGGVDDQFLKNYDELLTAFPEASKEFQMIKRAQDRVVAAKANVESATKTDVAAQKAAGKAFGEEVKTVKDLTAKNKAGLRKSLDKMKMTEFETDPSKFINASLSKDGRDLKRLHKEMQYIEGGQDIVKNEVISSVTDGLLSKVSESGSPRITMATADKYFKQRNSLEKSGIFTADELAALDEKVGRVNISGMVKSQGNRLASEVDSKIADFTSSVVAAGSLSMLPASNQLLLGGTVRRNVKSMLMKEDFDVSKMKALEDIITNPKGFIDAVISRKVKTEKELAELLATYKPAMVSGQAQAVTHLAENEEKE